MTYFFTSDYHLGHANIINYCGRPFKDLKHMNETIIKNHNARVTPDDTVFFLGDFCFKNSKGGKKGEGDQVSAKEYLKSLNGNFVFIRGNHDKNNSLKVILTEGVIDFGGEQMFMVHDPADHNPNFKFNLVGHVHEKWKFKKIKDSILINVGVDMWEYKPITINEIFKELRSMKLVSGN